MPHPDAGYYPGTLLGSRWRVGPQLGEGNFSMVFEATDENDGRVAAVKILSITQAGNSASLIEFDTDIALLRRLGGSSNVVDILDAGVEPIQVTLPGGATFPISAKYLVMEQGEGNLAELLVNRTALDWSDRLSLLRGVVKGAHQMHLERIVHRDIKADNVILVLSGNSVEAKLCDFGRSRDTTMGARFAVVAYETGRGDRRFAPPELLWGLGSSDAETLWRGDLFLLGSMFFEVATGQGITSLAFGDPLAVLQNAQQLPPQQREHDFEGRVADIRSLYELAYATFAAEVPRSIRNLATDLLRQLTEVRPSDRQPGKTRRERGLPIMWDLQWLLRRVDIMALTLSTSERAAARRRQKSGGRA